MLDGIETKTGVDYFSEKKSLDAMAKNIVYTGKIDEYFEYSLGELDYRTQRFVTERLEGDFQGVAGVNYTEKDIPFTRIIEHKHFEFLKLDHTYITKDYPDVWSRDKVPYYPINDKSNNLIYEKYKNLSKSEKNVIFGGRLAEYKYYDMHQVIGSAMSKAKRVLGEK